MIIEEYDSLRLAPTVLFIQSVPSNQKFLDRCRNLFSEIVVPNANKGQKPDSMTWSHFKIIWNHSKLLEITWNRLEKIMYQTETNKCQEMLWSEMISSNFKWFSNCNNAENTEFKLFSLDHDWIHLGVDQIEFLFYQCDFIELQGIQPVCFPLNTS